MIFSIQYLRFIACIMVVVLHITKKISLNSGGEDGYFYLGASGVDIFFVISGFIMAYISNKKESNGLVFIKSRIVRIYPIYAITLIPYILIFIAAPELVNSHGQPPSILKSITLIPFISGSYVNMVSWTLSFEFYFYIIFAVSLFISKKAIETSSIIILSLLLIGVLFDITLIKSAIVIEFLIGMWIFKILNGREVKKSIAIAIIMLGLILISTSSNTEVGGTGFDRVVYYGIPSTIIFIGFLLINQTTHEIKSLSLLGAASYSIYLTHIITINAIYFLFKKITNPSDFYWFVVAIATLSSVVVGLLAYKLIEVPSSKLIRSLFIKKTTPTNT